MRRPGHSPMLRTHGEPTAGEEALRFGWASWAIHPRFKKLTDCRYAVHTENFIEGRTYLETCHNVTGLLRNQLTSKPVQHFGEGRGLGFFSSASSGLWNLSSTRPIANLRSRHTSKRT